MPGSYVSLGVGMHVCEPGVPEEPYVLFIRDGPRVEKVVINFRIRPRVEEVRRDGMDP